MRKLFYLFLVFALGIGLVFGISSFSFAKTTDLRMMVAGDQNMVDFFQYEIAPLFEKENPGIKVSVIGTGPGPAGSRQIIQQLEIEKNSGKKEWNIDLAVVHEIGAVWALQKGLLLKYATPDMEAKKMAIRKTDEWALGANVDGYVIPMFHSQTAIAYNPKYVKEPPKSYAKIVEWAKAHKGKFGYNGVKHGASGISFTAGWLYWKSKYADKLMYGPYDKKYESDWEGIFKELKEFNKYVTMTSGNAGTLDMLNRGEIWTGPVWVDMFYTWVNDGRLDPNLRIFIPAPGMPGQPMHYVIAKKAKHAALAKKFIDFVSSPKIQAKYIVEKFNWYPGIGDKFVIPYLPKKVLESLYKDVKQEDLLKYGKPFPLTQYFEDMLEAYEKWVEK